MADKDDDLDTETSFADMNVDGFKWYDPSAKKKGKSNGKVKITRKEYRAMVKGAFEALLPLIGCIVVAMLAVFIFAYLWLKK